METTEHVDELFKGMYALKSKLQQPTFDAHVDYTNKKGQRIKFEYATLKAVIEAIRSAAQESNSGIDFQQEVTNSEGELKVSTMITHISGQYAFYDPFTFVSNGMDPQSIASLTTYAKRYSLCAAFGIAADKDDDGKVASDHEAQETKQTNNPSEPSIQLSQPQISIVTKKIDEYLSISGMSVDEFQNNLNRELGFIITEPAQLTKQQFGVLINYLTKKLKELNESKANSSIPWGQRQ